MKPVELCEPSPSERRPRLRPSLPSPTSSDLLALRSPAPAGSITTPATWSVKDAACGDAWHLSRSSRNEDTSTSSPAHPSPSASSSQNTKPGASIRDVLAGGGSHTSPPLAAAAVARSSSIDRLHRGESTRRLRKRQPRILCASQGSRRPRRRRKVTHPSATHRSHSAVEFHRSASSGESTRRLRKRQPRILCASQSMPDLPSEIEGRESRQSQALRVLRCRKAVRDWIERQWMRRHGKEVEPRVQENELVQYKQMFAMLDADGSGNLDIRELQSAMRFIGMKVSADELRERIAVVDTSRDGLIDIMEFVQLMSKGTFEGFDVTAQRERDHKKAAAEDDSIVTGAPRCHQRSRSDLKPKGKAKPKEPLMADLPFCLWIPAYHRRRTMAALMQGKVVADLENLSADSYTPYEYLDKGRAEKVVKNREDALKKLTYTQRHNLVASRAAVPRKPRVASPFKYEPPAGLPEPYSKAKPASLVRAETRLRRGIGFSRPRRPRITDLRVPRSRGAGGEP